MCIKSVHADTHEWLTLDEFRACVAYVQAQRQASGPFEVVMSGEMAEDRQAALAQMRTWATAGATWWMEEGLGWTFEEFRERIRQGPPRE